MAISLRWPRLWATTSQEEYVRATLRLEPLEAALESARRKRRLHTVQIPLNRGVGFAIIALGLVVVNAMGPLVPWYQVLGVVGLYAAYCVVSWRVLVRWYDPAGRLDLGLVFLALDLPLWMLLVYVSGAMESLAFGLVLLRSADQATTSARRVLAFSAGGIACYVVMAWYAAVFDGQAVRWTAEAAKIALLAGAGVYFAITAEEARRLRDRTRQAMRVARESLEQVKVKSQQLAVASARAEEAHRAKVRFLSSVSHELRSPLTVILGYASLLKDSAASPADLAQDAAEIERAGRQLLGLIDAVLDTTRLDPGRASLHVELVDLDDFVDERSIAMRLSKERSGNTFDVVKPAALGTAVVDAARLRGALRPLLDNAAKFTRQGRVTLRCERDPRRGGVRFQVIDTGPGIPDEDLARIRRFEPFSQVDASPARTVDGIGLGLVIAARSCALLGGRLAVDSVPEVGTVATVEIADTPVDGYRQTPLDRG